jgi:hypothetical protein
LLPFGRRVVRNHANETYSTATARDPRIAKHAIEAMFDARLATEQPGTIAHVREEAFDRFVL